MVDHYIYHGKALLEELHSAAENREKKKKTTLVYRLWNIRSKRSLFKSYSVKLNRTLIAQAY